MDTPHFWEELRRRVRDRIGEEDYEAWFAPLSVRGGRAGELVIIAPSRISADYLRDHYDGLLAQLCRDISGAAVPVRVITAEDGPPPSSAHAVRAPLNLRYTFATFVAGSSNQFARAAALSVAENPGRAYNPLFLYAGSGLGKTHLLHAIGNQVAAVNKSARISYVPTEHFVNELINSIRLQRMQGFREAYRSVDVLLLDDVHMLAGKERTQEEFFHTFNALHEAGHQLVLTSDTAPAQIRGLEERLRTRFVWGLVADIQPPDLETKCAIIRDKAHAEGVDLDDDTVLFIARRVRENIRELEGYLNRVIIYCGLTGQTATVETARSALQPLLPEEKHVSSADIIRFVAHHYGVKVSDLKGRDNRRSVAFPRQIAMYLIREILNQSYPEIGRLFSKHHSTVMYSVEQIGQQRRTNPALDSTLTTFAEHFR
jgi:chromosomal replication initiator protein